MSPEKLIENIEKRERHCWGMVLAFAENRDAHGVMDMGAELQALDRAKKEVSKLCSNG